MLYGVLAIATACEKAYAQPAEGIVVEGRSVIEAPADGARISLLISGSGTSPQSAINALADSSAEVMREFVAAGAFTGSIFDASAPPAPTNSVMSDTATTQTTNQSWKATRELRGTIPLRSAASLIVTLQKLDAVQVQSVSPEYGERATLEQKTIEEATVDASRKSAAAARKLGFSVGAVRDVRVVQKETRGPNSIALEAIVNVRYTLVPATSRNEVLAIAAAAAPSTDSTGLRASQPVEKAVSTEDIRSETPALAVEVVAATYDATGRGRFTTATGTVWRETVPTPAQQRLKNGRKYVGTISLGIFGGYRMELTGVPRVLKVEPVKLESSHAGPRAGS